MYYEYDNIKNLQKIITPYEELKKVNIFLVRHGESEVNIFQKDINQNKKISNDFRIEDSKIGLSTNGKVQAEKIGAKIKKYIEENNIKNNEILLLVSPYKRARETFEKANEKIKLDKNNENIFILNSLREQSYGAFHMLSNDEKRKKFFEISNECNTIKEPFFKPQFLGESPADVSDRLWNVINFIREKIKINNIKNVFIIAHRNVNMCIIMDILNLPPEYYEKLKEINNNIWQIKDGKIMEKIDI